jgi:acyl-CoA reductase-like NAD-dependent aldehyde dehydrogenase
VSGVPSGAAGVLEEDPLDGLTVREQAFIDGRFVAAADGRTFSDVSPRDGRIVAEVARGSGVDVDRAVRAARRAFEEGAWALADPAQRRAVLLRLAELMSAHAEELARLESVDVGHPISDARAVDVVNATRCFTFYAEAIDKLYGEIAPTGAEDLALVGREPIGVVGAVVPWNYPLIVTAWKLAPALAMGNSVVLKPAEQSPLSALRLAELASEAGLPDGVLNVVPGFGAEAGEPLGRHPDVDKIAFTGSVPVGRLFLRYAGESNGKAVSLELGGKSPQIVLADAPDLQAAAEAIGWGIFYNAGQTCHAGSRLIVVEEVREEILERLSAFAAGMAPGDPFDPATQLGSLVSDEHLHNVLAGGRRRLPRADARAGRRPRPGDRPGGGVRSRAGRPDGTRRRSRAGARQRHPLRPGGSSVDVGPHDGGAPRPPAARRHRVGQLVRPLLDGDAVRRDEGVRTRARSLAARARRLRAAQDDVDPSRMRPGCLLNRSQRP